MSEEQKGDLQDPAEPKRVEETIETHTEKTVTEPAESDED